MREIPARFTDTEGYFVSEASVYHLLNALDLIASPAYIVVKIDVFVGNYNHLRYHESLGNLTPADVYFERGQTILLERERIKRHTIQNRRLLHHRQAA